MSGAPFFVSRFREEVMVVFLSCLVTYFVRFPPATRGWFGGVSVTKKGCGALGNLLLNSSSCSCLTVYSNCATFFLFKFVRFSATPSFT